MVLDHAAVQIGVSVIHRAEPLTQKTFEPFGEVIEHRGEERRHYLEMNFARPGDRLRHAIWVSKLNVSRALPLNISKLERHPFSDQAFIPLSGQPFLVVTCPDDEDGSPDLQRCRAFVGTATQGVIYRRNVWHSGLEVLGTPAEFVVVMALSDDQPNDIFIQLPRPIQIDPGGP